MVKRGDKVLIDTMVIIEAHRVALWNSLVEAFNIETVETCLVEAGSGNYNKQDYVPVNPDCIRAQISVYDVTDIERASLMISFQSAQGLHDGERDLLALVNKHANVWFLCCPDRAAIVCAHTMGCLDRCVSLESLADLSAGKYTFHKNYTEIWLSKERLKLKLEDLGS